MRLAKHEVPGRAVVSLCRGTSPMFIARFDSRLIAIESHARTHHPCSRLNFDLAKVAQPGGD